MNCRNVQEMLADFLGEELAPGDRRAFDEHLAECGRCRSDVESLRQTLLALRQLPPPPAWEAQGDARLARAETPARHPLWRHFGQALAYAAVLLIGTGIGWITRPAEHAPPQSGPAPVVQPGLPAYERGPESVRPSRFVRNALALSSAFTRGSRK